jgi:hypothetical protein
MEREPFKVFTVFWICITVAVIFAIMADCERHRHDANAKAGKFSRATMNECTP